MVAWCGLITCRRRLFSGRNDFPGFLKTCNSPVAVFLHAAGAFFSVKMTFLGFVGHVIALLGSSYVPQALFFCKNGVPGIFKTRNNPVMIFSRAAGVFLFGKNDVQAFSVSGKKCVPEI